MSAEVKKIPQRQCVGCREKKDKTALLRIVRCADGGAIELDRTGKKAGRGAYICPSAACLKKAKRHLSSALDCLIPDEVYEKLEKEIENND